MYTNVSDSATVGVLLRMNLNGWRLGLADRNATDERFPAFFTPLTQSVSFLEKQA